RLDLPRSARVRGAAGTARAGMAGTGATGVRPLSAVILVPVVPGCLCLRRRVLVLTRLPLVRFVFLGRSGRDRHALRRVVMPVRLRLIERVTFVLALLGHRCASS